MDRITYMINLVPRVVSEPLFQSSYQKTTLVQGVVFYGEFDFIAMKFRMACQGMVSILLP